MDITDLDVSFYKKILDHPHTNVETIGTVSKSKYLENGKKLYFTKGQRKGYLISFVDPDNPDMICIGFSMCNVKMDRFDKVNNHRIKDYGKFLAIERALKYKHFSNIEVPQTVYNLMEKFLIRANRYYKDKDFPEWAEDFNYTVKEIE